MTHWRILSYVLSTPLFRLVSIALTVTNTVSACPFDFPVGQINTGTFGLALTSCWSGHSGSWMLLSSSIWDSTSATQSSLLSFGLSRSQLQFSQSSVSEILSGALSSPLLTRWRLILRIWWRFINLVCSPGRSFADKAGCEGDISQSLNEAAPWCWKRDRDALMISSVSEMYPMAAIFLFWARDPFRVACRLSLLYHRSNKSRTLAILCNFLSSASFFIHELFSVFVVSNDGSLPATMPLLARANYVTMTISRMVVPVVLNASSLRNFAQGKNWTPHQHHLVW